MKRKMIATAWMASAVFLSFNLNAQAQFIQHGNKITATGLVDYDHFGHGVAITGDGATIAAGAPYADATNNGKVFLYTRTTTGWNLSQQLLESANGSTSAYMGKHLAFSKNGDVLVVSGHGTFTDTGRVWVYRKDATGSYVVEQKLSSNGQTGAGGYFGDALDISADGNTIIVASPRDNSVGAVFIFRYQSGAWVQDGSK